MALQHSASSTPYTIWTLVHETQFLKTIQEVSNVSGKVPGEAHVYDQSRSQACNRSRQLPRGVEYQLAQDLAFIAANKEGAHSVSAATVEELATQQGLIFNIASNSGVGPSVREAFSAIGILLEQCARKGIAAASLLDHLLKRIAILEISESECTESIFISVVQLCEHRVIGRLKCKDWIAPVRYSKRLVPMHKDLKDTVDRHMRKNGGLTDEMRTIIKRLQDFIKFMSEAYREDSTPTFVTRLEALRLAGKVCGMRSSLEIAFERAGTKLDIASQKAIKAFDKLANYQHLSERLSRVAASSRFRHLFKSNRFRFLDHYQCRRVYGQKTYVHAEVQLAVFHRLQRTRPSPRTIGTTKAACYLCNLFLSLHPQYTISATHGVIYEAWTIPDVMSYSAEDRRELRGIIRSMQDTLEARARGRNCRFLQFPVQSGIYHAPSLPSLAGTVIGAAASVVGESRFTVPTDPRTQGAVESAFQSLADAVTVPSADHHVGSPLEMTIKSHSQQSVVVDEHYSTDKEPKLQEESNFLHGSKLDKNAEHEREVEPDETSEPYMEAKLDGDAVNGDVSGPEGDLLSKQGSKGGEVIHDIDCTLGCNSECVLFTKRSQMPCDVDISPERPNLSRKPNRKGSESSPPDGADDSCASTVHLSGDHLDRSANVPVPTVIKPVTTRKTLRRAEQEVQEPLPKRSRKKRRRRHHTFESHHRNGREDYEILRAKRSGSGRSKAPRRGKKRQHYGHRSSKTTQHSYRFKNSRSRYSFVQGLLRVIRGARRLFCG